MNLKRVVLVVALTVVFVLVASSALAATGDDGRLAAELVVDKTDIKGGETVAIIARVGVTTTNTYTNARLNVQLPAGLTLATGSTTAVFDYLDVERDRELSLTAIADACPTPPPTEPDTPSKTPATGDRALLIASSSLTLVASLGLLATSLGSRMRTHSKAARIISLLLCGVLLTLAFGPLTAAMAAPTEYSFNVVQPITICGVAKDIVLTVTYDYEKREEPVEPVTIILDNVVHVSGYSTLAYLPGTNEFTLQRHAFEGVNELNDLTLYFHLSDESVQTIQIDVEPFVYWAETGMWINSSFQENASTSGLMNAPYANTFDIDWAITGTGSRLWTSPRYGSGTLGEAVIQTITLSVPGNPEIAPLVITGTVLPGPNPT